MITDNNVQISQHAKYCCSAFQKVGLIALAKCTAQPSPFWDGGVTARYLRRISSIGLLPAIGSGVSSPSAVLPPWELVPLACREATPPDAALTEDPMFLLSL